MTMFKPLLFVLYFYILSTVILFTIFNPPEEGICLLMLRR
jgi:hypothetical protein